MPVDTSEITAGLITPLRVENQEANVTTFAKTVGGEFVRIIWQPKGHPGATQRVPLALAQDVDFINSLENGTLKVTGGPADIVQALQFETDTVRAEREAQVAQVDSVLDRRQDKDMVGLTCIAPKGNGRDGECGRSLVMSAKQSAEVPPLCSQHQHLTPTFHLTVVGSKGEGATESREGVVRREWKQATLTAPIKESGR
jgi:hypothetical protein